MINSPYTRWTGDEVHGKQAVVTPVWVHLDALFRRSKGDPVHTVGDGLDLEGWVEGFLTGWFRSVKGDWLGVTNFAIRYADGRRDTLHVKDQLVPKYALRKRETRADS